MKLTASGQGVIEKVLPRTSLFKRADAFRSKACSDARPDPPAAEGGDLSRIGNWQRLFLIFGGVMSGFVVMVTAARAFFYFLKK